MASTFDENKKMKSEQSSCQSWFQHLGIEKPNNFTFSAKFFSARRNTKTSSKSDDTSDVSTTDQGNGQDLELGEAEPEEDSDPDLHRLQSDWNEFCLVYCDECSYFYAHSAFVRHKDERHIPAQGETVFQHSLYEKKSIPEQDGKKRKNKNGREKNALRQIKKPVNTDNTKNNDSDFNVVGKRDVKSGPGPGKKRARRTLYGNKKKKVKTVLENPVNSCLQSLAGKCIEDLQNKQHFRLLGGQNCMEEYPKDVGNLVYPVDDFSMHLNVSTHCGNSSSEGLVNNQSTNSLKMSPEPLINTKVNNIINCKARNCSLCEKSPLPSPCCCEMKLNDIFPNAGSNCKMEISQNVDGTKVLLKSNPSWTLTTDCANNSDFHNDVLEKKLQYGTPPKRFNGDFKKGSAQRSSVNCVENLKQDSSFHNENDAYLVKLRNGCELKSWKCVSKTKPDVKLKRRKIQAKLINQLTSPIYDKCLQTIKLEPIKIKKALNSINRVYKTRTIEQFRTFSHLKRILPSGKKNPRQSRVSCTLKEKAANRIGVGFIRQSICNIKRHI